MTHPSKTETKTRFLAAALLFAVTSWVSDSAVAQCYPANDPKNPGWDHVEKVAQATTCAQDAFTACLIGGRYKVTSHWKNQYSNPPGQVSTLSATRLTDGTAAFSQATSLGTYEYVIRITTGHQNAGDPPGLLHSWINISTFTSVEFWVEVTDTMGSHQSFEYHSPPGNCDLCWFPWDFVYQ
jgi:hypothetical protein